MSLSRADKIVAGSLAILVLGVAVVVMITDPWEPDLPLAAAGRVVDLPEDTVVVVIDVPRVYDGGATSPFTVTPDAVVRGEATRIIEARALQGEGRFAALILELTFDYTPLSPDWGSNNETYPMVYNDRGFSMSASSRRTADGQSVVSIRYDAETEGLLTFVLGPGEGE